MKTSNSTQIVPLIRIEPIIHYLPRGIADVIPSMQLLSLIPIIYLSISCNLLGYHFPLQCPRIFLSSFIILALDFLNPFCSGCFVFVLSSGANGRCNTDIYILPICWNEKMFFDSWSAVMFLIVR